jgi:5-methylcytosine-specific restriction enzyme B
MLRRSDSRVRSLSVEELGLVLPGGVDSAPAKVVSVGSVEPPKPLSDDHWLSRDADYLLSRHGGLILQGPPGTSKSYLAAGLALRLAGSSARIRLIQFHPSYQYEDFIESPTIVEGNFEVRARHLVEMAEEAEDAPDLTFVIVIDELSRGDAARIFGEALTYVEHSKRGLPFSLASGREFAIPENLVFLATMNPFDRGVDEVDAAFERRFAKISLDPSVEILGNFLSESQMSDGLRRDVEDFFRFANDRAASNPYGALGHAYFLKVANKDDLKRLWRFQLQFFFAKAYQLDDAGRLEIEDRWQSTFGDAQDADESTESDKPLIS